MWSSQGFTGKGFTLYVSSLDIGRVWIGQFICLPIRRRVTSSCGVTQRLSLSRCSKSSSENRSKCMQWSFPRVFYIKKSAQLWQIGFNVLKKKKKKHKTRVRLNMSRPYFQNKFVKNNPPCLVPPQFQVLRITDTHHPKDQAAAFASPEHFWNTHTQFISQVFLCANMMFSVMLEKRYCTLLLLIRTAILQSFPIRWEVRPPFLNNRLNPVQSHSEVPLYKTNNNLKKKAPLKINNSLTSEDKLHTII